jgi:hypothetical protein
VERAFRTSFGHFGLLQVNQHKIHLFACTPIGTQKLNFQIFGEKISTILKMIALIANWYWPLPMKISLV